MFHPVGSQPPSVYWRRRVLFVGSTVLVVVLLVVTLRAVTSDGGSANTAAGTTSSSSRPRASTPVGSSSTSASPTAAASSTHRSGSSSPKSVKAPSSTPPATCRTSDLAVSAVVAAPNYKIGATPTLEMQVTNVGKAPCVQDLADKQIVLKVYNGESRVWGSHDCETQPGTALRTLAVNSPVRVTLTWSGLTSSPNSCKSRQRVGAGTYTLYATLSGKTGKAAQFTIS